MFRAPSCRVARSNPSHRYTRTRSQLRSTLYSSTLAAKANNPKNRVSSQHPKDIYEIERLRNINRQINSIVRSLPFFILVFVRKCSYNSTMLISCSCARNYCNCDSKILVVAARPPGVYACMAAVCNGAYVCFVVQVSRYLCQYVCVCVVCTALIASQVLCASSLDSFSQRR